MAALLIKDLPADLHKQLKRRAESNHRSMTKEAMAILEAALKAEQKRPTLEQIDRWRVRPRKPLTEAFLRQAKRTGRS